MVKHIISVSTITKEQILHYISRAEQFKRENAYYDLLKNKILVNVFFEPSTRTSCSFQKAMINLGGSVIHITEQYSSVKKGESFEDTIKTLSNYGDILVLRHPTKGYAEIASNISTIPVINAGDGNGEHPTQALLDIFTIKTELAKYGLDICSLDRNEIVVSFMGDLKNSRTIHSLIRMLSLFPKISFMYVHPDGLGMPKEINDKLVELNISFVECSTLEEALRNTDILYVTRIQKERFENEAEYNAIMLEEKYIIDANILQYAKQQMIIMHPLPRLNEIAVEVDTDSRAVYFEQVKNGVYMRMALLEDSILDTV